MPVILGIVHEGEFMINAVAYLCPSSRLVIIMSGDRFRRYTEIRFRDCIIQAAYCADV